MTVNVIYNPEIFAVDGLSYEYTFETIGADVVEVFEVDAGGVRTYVDPTGYTIALGSGVPVYVGGIVTFGSTVTVGTVGIVIERSTPITQLIDLENYGRFPPDVIEFGLDKLTMIAQEMDANKCECDEVTP
jgi:hypothetical protein